MMYNRERPLVAGNSLCSSSLHSTASDATFDTAQCERKAGRHIRKLSQRHGMAAYQQGNGRAAAIFKAFRAVLEDYRHPEQQMGQTRS